MWLSPSAKCAVPSKPFSDGEPVGDFSLVPNANSPIVVAPASVVDHLLQPLGLLAPVDLRYPAPLTPSR